MHARVVMNNHKTARAQSGIEIFKGAPSWCVQIAVDVNEAELRVVGDSFYGSGEVTLDIIYSLLADQSTYSVQRRVGKLTAVRQVPPDKITLVEAFESVEQVQRLIQPPRSRREQRSRVALVSAQLGNVAWQPLFGELVLNQTERCRIAPCHRDWSCPR